MRQNFRNHAAKDGGISFQKLQPGFAGLLADSGSNDHDLAIPQIRIVAGRDLHRVPASRERRAEYRRPRPEPAPVLIDKDDFPPDPVHHHRVGSRRPDESAANDSNLDAHQRPPDPALIESQSRLLPDCSIGGHTRDRCTSPVIPTINGIFFSVAGFAEVSSPLLCESPPICENPPIRRLRQFRSPNWFYSAAAHCRAGHGSCTLEREPDPRRDRPPHLDLVDERCAAPGSRSRTSPARRPGSSPRHHRARRTRPAPASPARPDRTRPRPSYSSAATTTRNSRTLTPHPRLPRRRNRPVEVDRAGGLASPARAPATSKSAPDLRNSRKSAVAEAPGWSMRRVHHNGSEERVIRDRPPRGAAVRQPACGAEPFLSCSRRCSRSLRRRSRSRPGASWCRR